MITDIEFIEKVLNIKLEEYQKRFIKKFPDEVRIDVRRNGK